MRCVAAVLSLCGVPTTIDDGKTPLFRDVVSTRKIAKEAVKNIYQHVGSPRDTAYLEQRQALALQFRKKYGSDEKGAANVNPFFIGVFDTVAALGSTPLSVALVGAVVGILALLSYIRSSFLFPFLPAFLWSFVAAVVAAAVW